MPTTSLTNSFYLLSIHHRNITTTSIHTSYSRFMFIHHNDPRLRQATFKMQGWVTCACFPAKRRTESAGAQKVIESLGGWGLRTVCGVQACQFHSAVPSYALGLFDSLEGLLTPPTFGKGSTDRKVQGVAPVFSDFSGFLSVPLKKEGPSRSLPASLGNMRSRISHLETSNPVSRSFGACWINRDQHGLLLFRLVFGCSGQGRGQTFSLLLTPMVSSA